MQARVDRLTGPHAILQEMMRETAQDGKPTAPVRSPGVIKSFLNVEQDARKYPRYTVHKIVSYSHGGKHLLTLTLDLALGGMKIKAHCDLPKDEHLNFKLVLGESSIWVRGKVAYSGSLSDKQRVAGVQFTELSTQDHTLLERYFSILEEWSKPPCPTSTDWRENLGLGWTEIIEGCPEQEKGKKLPKKSSKKDSPKTKRVQFDVFAPEAAGVSLAEDLWKPSR